MRSDFYAAKAELNGKLVGLLQGGSEASMFIASVNLGVPGNCGGIDGAMAGVNQTWAESASILGTRRSTGSKGPVKGRRMELIEA